MISLRQAKRLKHGDVLHDLGNIWVIVGITPDHPRQSIIDVLAYCTEEDARQVLAELEAEDSGTARLELHNVDLRTNVR